MSIKGFLVRVFAYILALVLFCVILYAMGVEGW